MLMGAHKEMAGSDEPAGWPRMYVPVQAKTTFRLTRPGPYVLEYTYIQTTQREDWLPRVRKVAPDGQVTTLATVDKAVRANARN